MSAGLNGTGLMCLFRIRLWKRSRPIRTIDLEKSNKTCNLAYFCPEVGGSLFI